MSATCSFSLTPHQGLACRQSAHRSKQHASRFIPEQERWGGWVSWSFLHFLPTSRAPNPRTFFDVDVNFLLTSMMISFWSRTRRIGSFALELQKSALLPLVAIVMSDARAAPVFGETNQKPGRAFLKDLQSIQSADLGSNNTVRSI